MSHERHIALVSLCIVATALGACGSGTAPPEDSGMAEDCDPSVDRDGDGIADDAERGIRWADDVDDDGVVNVEDEDSDDDGVLDVEEVRSSDPCAPADTDGDGVPDAYDLDSDGDGLTDAEERAHGTRRTKPDTDGDGVSDYCEVEGPGTSPINDDDTIALGDFVVLEHEGARETRDVRAETALEVADVFFLVDTTASMRSERKGLIRGLLDVIIPGIQRSIPDVQFGVAGLDDYPYEGYGLSDDLPFYLLREIAPPGRDAGAWTVDASDESCPDEIGLIAGAPNGRADILEAVEGLACHLGADIPESYVPAMWATATGSGLGWPSAPEGVAPQQCPDEGRVGYPCFRPEALPIIILVGDAPFHNGPEGAYAYDFPAAPQYIAARTSLTTLGARVIGIYSGDDTGRDHYERIAEDTGAVDADGAPLVFDLPEDESGLDEKVVDAVQELAATSQDVTARAQNVPGNPDGLDATTFVDGIAPVEGYLPDGTPGGYESKDETSFYGTTPQTEVEFEVQFHNEVREPPADAPEIFEARIEVVGSETTVLGSRLFYVVVPPEGGAMCISAG